jgi:hypothetical protein
MFCYCMTKIILDTGATIFDDQTKDNFKPYNALVLTGGGTSQTLFAMGAIQRIIEDMKIISGNENDDIFSWYKLISSTSGGTIVATFMEVVLLKGYHKRKNWFKRYVVDNLYRLSQSRIGAKFLLSGIKVSNSVDILREIIRPASLIDFKHINKKHGVTFLYNYIDATSQLISCDHSDMMDECYNIKIKGLSYLEIFTERIVRCCLPFHISEYNKKMSLDAGYTANNTITTLFPVYGKPTNMTIILKAPRCVTNEKTEAKYSDLIVNINSIVQNVANTSSNDIVDRLINPRGNNMIVSTNNDLNKSAFRFHKKLWFTFDDISFLNNMYTGLLFYDGPSAMVIEQEGYLQTFTAINDLYTLEGRKLKSKLYPEVYGPQTKQIIENYKNINVIKSFIGDIFTELFS